MSRLDFCRSYRYLVFISVVATKTKYCFDTTICVVVVVESSPTPFP